MAEENENGQDKTEDATPERREEFREKGHVASSREVTSVFVLVGAIAFLSLYLPNMGDALLDILKLYFEKIATFRVTSENIFQLSLITWMDLLLLILPIFALVSIIATAVTLLQTRFNFSWEKISPDYSRLSFSKGLVRMINLQALVELLKGSGKLGAIFLVSYLILFSEIKNAPGLINLPLMTTWAYWGDVTKLLFYWVAALLLVIAAGDYIYNYFSLEKQMRMSKQDIKEEYKRREADPQVKGRLRRMQRDILSQKMVEKTAKATVIITNPTHYSIALLYEVGMGAPIVVAKGIDFLALQMREVAKENSIPMIENRLLARTLYRLVEVDEEIPDSLYKAVSEIIKYVFNLKGIKVGAKS
ncbi:MAG: flagellar biosynthesis protein FlhB [Oligoflexales bacterium]|nr:flagellar biosynthesis protein FlhB [Oligoflexales bacterium]